MDINKYTCVIDTKSCVCKNCIQNKKTTGGSCTYCMDCIQGERVSDACEELHKMYNTPMHVVKKL